MLDTHRQYAVYCAAFLLAITFLLATPGGYQRMILNLADLRLLSSLVHEEVIHQTNGSPFMQGVVAFKQRRYSQAIAWLQQADTDQARVRFYLAQAENKNREGVEIAAELIMEIKDICQGVHIMAIGWERKVPSIIEAAKL